MGRCRCGQVWVGVGLDGRGYLEGVGAGRVCGRLGWSGRLIRGETHNGPCEVGMEVGLNPRLFSCNYVYIDHVGSETTGHLVTDASSLN